MMGIDVYSLYFPWFIYVNNKGKKKQKKKTNKKMNDYTILTKWILSEN